MSLLLLIFFIYSILGVFLFNEIESGDVIDEYTNFHDFHTALITLVRASTGEEWNVMMYDCYIGF